MMNGRIGTFPALGPSIPWRDREERDWCVADTQHSKGYTGLFSYQLLQKADADVLMPPSSDFKDGRHLEVGGLRASRSGALGQSFKRNESR